MTRLQSAHVLPFDSQVLWCFDTEDVEGWLIEEGIGHRSRNGTFEYGSDPTEEYTDIPCEAELDDLDDEIS